MADSARLDKWIEKTPRHQYASLYGLPSLWRFPDLI
jgi:hypothetical protein